MKVYSDLKGSYIKIRNPSFKAGTEFMIVEDESEIILKRIDLA